MTRSVTLPPEKLEHQLVLVGWLVDQLGYSSNEAMLRDLATADEGTDATGRSYTYHSLVGRGAQVRMSPQKLADYDANIVRHLANINRNRAEPVVLRYFQYLALLFTEIFLDRLSRDQPAFNTELNTYVSDFNDHRPVGAPHFAPFGHGDMARLAFWMATGSGKTLLMHAHYHQFLHYMRGQRDNILLVTPNEGLSRQHIEELELSGIPAERFVFDVSGLTLAAPNTVRVLEITKLVEEKRGGGVSVPVEHFAGRNLIFVDEGHRGSGGDSWRGYREALARTGFTFEYSATFGQALGAARNSALSASYGKSIAFDYSYRYFYGDGFGKDFRIVNLQKHLTEATQRLLLLGNLLSFYEQKLRFERETGELRAYNVADPLWVFVGSSVNAVYTEGKRERSDVLTVARFLHSFFRNGRQWATQGIDKLLRGATGLEDAAGRDLFADRYSYLRAQYSGRYADVYAAVLSTVFHSQGAGGGLVIRDLRGQGGELGLQISSSRTDFGVIYVGDTAKFKRLVEEDDSGITIEEDVVSESLFRSVNVPGSKVNVLVGSKKFTEGWSSWRVTSMCLLNIGRSEGSEVIQLFGRGVRLLGLGRSLKRSSSLSSTHPEGLQLLETLNIFSVRANYMTNFRAYLEREGVDPDGHFELTVPIRPDTEFLHKRLLMPRLSGIKRFQEQQTLALGLDRSASVVLDITPRMQAVASTAEGVTASSVGRGQDLSISPTLTGLLDWDDIARQVLQYKVDRGFDNLVVMPGSLRALVELDPPVCRVRGLPGMLDPRSFAHARQLQEVVVSVLKKYVERFVRARQQRWETDNMTYTELAQSDGNFKDYTVKVPHRDAALVATIQRLIADGGRLYSSDLNELPNIFFDRHLYRPLLVERGAGIKFDPPGLGGSESRFVADLRAHLTKNPGQLGDTELFLLRNLTRGKGIGFFEKEGFYPDFILWLRAPSGDQKLVFVEPHGMRHEASYWTSDKAQLFERLAALAGEWQASSPGPEVKLDSYLISHTPFAELQPIYDTGDWSVEKFAERHILFFETPSYVEAILT